MKLMKWDEAFKTPSSLHSLIIVSYLNVNDTNEVGDEAFETPSSLHSLINVSYLNVNDTNEVRRSVAWHATLVV